MARDMADEPGGFVERGLGTVAEIKPGALEVALGPADPVGERLRRRIFQEKKPDSQDLQDFSGLTRLKPKKIYELILLILKNPVNPVKFFII